MPSSQYRHETTGSGSRHGQSVREASGRPGEVRVISYRDAEGVQRVVRLEYRPDVILEERRPRNATAFEEPPQSLSGAYIRRAAAHEPASQDVDHSTHLRHDNLVAPRAARSHPSVWIEFMMHRDALEEQLARLDNSMSALYTRSAVPATSTTLEDTVISRATSRVNENNIPIIDRLDDKRKSDINKV
ncbi:hypothetical protein G647_06934 [Cladophialophora carrionii CBS 160.54]|uniref:Uncharacterized protein n=1 Tax=Cladophialophora carrionii CBS 160.54 TaxID=1279043 RepID=V9DA94_9EURO|nr:uncharacterized protein G647_06934 [Cladophialophora carrionii CBS 160.54]ETI22857.1 hypothetical protein G647_06934 [Cladophialophora carrionii CBS 160.54]